MISIVMYRRSRSGDADSWTSGDNYEPYVGRWSRLVAKEFLEWLGPPYHAEWLDVGCGTGAVSETIFEVAQPRAVEGVDPSDEYVAFALRRLKGARFTAQVGDAQKLPYPDRFDVTVSGLVLNFVPSPDAAVKEMARVTRPGGIVASYVWDYAGRMQMMRYFWDAVLFLHPQARDKDEGLRFPIAQPAALQDLFEGAGLQDVEVRGIEVPTVFLDFDDLWNPFLGGDAPAPGYCKSLGDEGRIELRELIKSRLPIDEDGAIRLAARAWGIRGLVA